MSDLYPRTHSHRKQPGSGREHRTPAREKDKVRSHRHNTDTDGEPEVKDQFELAKVDSMVRSEGGVVVTSPVSNFVDRDDATTAVTGATSDYAYSLQDSDDEEYSIGIRCARFSGPLTTGLIGLLAFVSPIVMVILPKMDLMGWNVEPCDANCQSILVSLGWRLMLLLIASCLLFLRSPTSTMPRIFVFRALVIFLIFVLTFTYWLFFIVRVYSTFGRNVEKKISYEEVAIFTLSFAEVLMFVHYLAVILIELRQLSTFYVVKITRSPDGLSQSYSVGRLSIQRLAVWCLEQYYRDFEMYNPYLEALPHRAATLPTNYKVYDLDVPASENQSINTSQTDVPVFGMRQRSVGHNDRYHKELDYERKVARRRARLLTAADNAFSVVRRILADEKAVSSQMSCDDVVQAIFQQLERPLDRYLRVTRQKLWYTKDSIMERIDLFIRHEMSARAFLEPYLKQASILKDGFQKFPPQTWTILCDHVVSRTAEHETTFQLRKGDVSLDVIVRQLPGLQLHGSRYQGAGAFVLRFDSEASL